MQTFIFPSAARVQLAVVHALISAPALEILALPLPYHLVLFGLLDSLHRHCKLSLIKLVLRRRLGNVH